MEIFPRQDNREPARKRNVLAKRIFNKIFGARILSMVGIKLPRSEIAASYRKVFPSQNENSMIVLEDLADKCGIFKHKTHNNPEQALIDMGMTNMYLYVISMITKDFIDVNKEPEITFEGEEK